MSKPKLNWEDIGGNTQRCKVIGGWLVLYHADASSPGYADHETQWGYEWRPAMAFVPDPKHEWKLDDET